MKRIVIIGSSCSGKTTLARAVAARLGLPHIELDALYWRPGWEETPAPEFRAAVTAAVTPDRWVVDGNYKIARDILWPRATTIVWLNLSFPVVFSRSLRRTVGRIVRREELFSGNRESFRQSFLSFDGIPWWVVRTHRANRRDVRAACNSDAYPHLEWIELTRSQQAAAWLESLGG